MLSECPEWAGRKQSRFREACGSTGEIRGIFFQCSKDFICINSFDLQNNPVMVFITFSTLEMETTKPREVQ